MDENGVNATGPQRRLGGITGKGLCLASRARLATRLLGTLKLHPDLAVYIQHT
jgi:hypothetical protein